MSRTISCRNCGASLTNGDVFYFVQFAEAAAVEQIVGIEFDGSPILSGLCDLHHTPLIHRDEIQCGSCDHQWRTTRPNPSDFSADGAARPRLPAEFVILVTRPSAHKPAGHESHRCDSRRATVTT